MTYLEIELSLKAYLMFGVAIPIAMLLFFIWIAKRDNTSDLK